MVVLSRLTGLLVVANIVFSAGAALGQESGSSDSDRLQSQEENERRAPSRARILDTIERKGRAAIIVQLGAADEPYASLSGNQTRRPAARLARMTAIERLQRRVLRALNHDGPVKRFTHLPYVALDVDEAALSLLASLPDVLTIQEDRILEPVLSTSAGQIGAPNAWSQGYAGADQIVAVLDTGVDRNHPAFTGKIGEDDGACFSKTSVFFDSVSLCPDGLDPSGNDFQFGADAAVPCDIPGAPCYHGTHVAGIAASGDQTYAGIAKDASIYPVQVFSLVDDCCLLAYTSDLIRALEHIYGLTPTRKVAAVNMSLGGQSYTSSAACDASNLALKQAIDNLRAVGVVTVVASGNGSASDQISEPACISSAVSVGAVNASNMVASFSNSADFLTALAPGVAIRSTMPGGSFASRSGTSMATPHMAGVFTVLKSLSPEATVEQMLSAVQSSGIPVLDSRNNVTTRLPQLDLATDALLNVLDLSELDLSLELAVSGAITPVAITHSGDGSGRLFVAQQSGEILIREGAGLSQTPFLDMSASVSCCSGAGLLGLAFHPGYSAADNGYFYVSYVDGVGDIVVARFRRLNSTQADPDSEEELLRIPAPSGSRYGGHLAFGRDGYLYIAVGDGGSGGLSGDLTSLFGKLLRIDVDTPSAYAIPPDNPYAGNTDPLVRQEIWASGLRNPSRIGFDRLTGELYIADVGETSWEEVNHEPADSAGGGNYGWNIMEGSECFGTQTCNQAGLTLPVAEYDHALGDCAITGGSVYRGNYYPQLQGAYFYGDFCSGRIWGLRQVGTDWESVLLLESALEIGTFGEDEQGNLYVADRTIGEIYVLLASVSISTEPVPSGTVWSEYSAQLTARGGMPAYQWSIVSGALPFGFELDVETGAITGTPAFTGSSTFTVRAQDANGDTDDTELSIEVFQGAVASHEITGFVSLEGAGLSGVGFDITAPAVCSISDTEGTYTCTVPDGWSGAVVPRLDGQVFTPESIDYASLISSQPGQDYVATSSNGLVGYWALDETGGTTAGDASGNGNAGTVRGGASWVAGQVGGALSLDGATQDVQVADSPSLSIEGGGLTIAGWIYPTEATSGALVHKERHYSLLRRSNGSLTYADSATWSYSAMGNHGSTPLNAWSHVAVTFDGSTVRFYIDGALVSTVNRPAALTDNANPLYLGSYAGTSYRFGGLVDEMGVYDRALSEQEISDLYGSGLVDTTAPEIDSVTALGATGLEVRFDEPVAALTAQDAGNYVIDQGVVVSQAVLEADNHTVTLSTTALSEGVTYTLTVDGVEDVSGNGIAPGSQATFSYTPVSTPGAVGWWALDEVGGTTAGDASGNGNAGTVRGGASWVAGQVGGALSLDGATQDVQVADSPSLSIEGGGLTIAGWIYPTEATSGALVHKERHYSLLRRSNGSLTYADSATWSYSAMGNHGSTPLNAWSHVAVTFDGSTVRFYIDGALVSTVNRPAALTDNANPLYLGSYAGTRYRFGGLVDEMGVYDRALSEQEISDLYGSGLVDTTAPEIDSVTALGATGLEVRFDEPVAALTAQDAGNYVIDQGVVVSQAVLEADNHTVTLSTTALSEGVTYTLTVDGVEDVSGNGIAPGSQATFSYTPVSTPGAVGWWALDEVGGTTAGDASGNGNAGTVRGGASWVAGQVGGALSLDGATQDVQVADSPSLSIEGGGLTIAGWIYPTEATSGALVHKERHYSLLRRSNGSLTYADSATWSYSAMGNHGSTPLNAWSHVAVTFDGSTVRFYIDGALVSTVNRPAALTDNANPLYLGSYAGTSYRFGGLVDEMGVYDRALSEQEISDLYGSGLVDTTAPEIDSVTALGATGLEVRFDEPVAALTAQDAGNYVIDQGVVVSQAVLEADNHTVTLSTTALSEGVTYTLTVDGVEDVSGNGIAPGSQATFSYTPVSTPGAVGWWALDEVGGTTAGDASGNGNAGTVRGGASWVAGQVGGALSLDGATQDVQVADSPSLSIEGGGLTIAGWIYPTEATSGALVHKERHYSLLRRSNGSLTYADSATWSYSAMGNHGSTPLNAWSHVAVTFDGSTVRFYIDGALVSTVNRPAALTDNANPLYLGSYAGTSYRFGGLVDEMGVYDRALSEQEISDLYGSGLVDTTAPEIDSVTALGATGLEVMLSSRGAVSPGHEFATIN